MNVDVWFGMFIGIAFLVLIAWIVSVYDEEDDDFSL